MDEKTNSLYLILQEEKNNIENFKNMIKIKGELTNRISIVTSELLDIKNDLNILEKNIEDELVKIETIEDKIREITKTEIINKANILVDILKHNLPKEINGEILYDSKQDEYEQVINLMKDDDIIGEIVIYSRNYDNLKIKVKFWEPVNKEEEFTIKQKYRIYKIISFINTNLSYDE
ncbi:hypothetical protein [Clostridium weizhouense]|uniref:Uncharacterized protein n=1 Tax=Clostridium weizhouense TaxID=2859781 RepID=A0ABS7AMU8_9CLOT|nr:hypothetical protein [Clostridium weizhouense]MBW6409408.1 hypothetical protein [Clostridium weizhouense]